MPKPRLPIAAHCEDETTVRANRSRFADTHDVADHSRIRDEQAAVIATRRAIDLAMRHHHRFHVLHVSTAAEVPLIAGHQPYVTAEACPHHLLFNVDDYARLGTLVQMNPSLKTARDNAGLWQALQDGVIQVIATDHAPHTLEEKQRALSRIPLPGLPAVENSLALMLDQVNRGRCSLRQVVHWMCEAPALVWDLVNKGRIEVGYDADLVLVDLTAQGPSSQFAASHQVRLESLARAVVAGLARRDLGSWPLCLSSRTVRHAAARERGPVRSRPRWLLGHLPAGLARHPVVDVLVGTILNALVQRRGGSGSRADTVHALMDADSLSSGPPCSK